MRNTLTDPPSDREGMMDVQRRVADRAVFEDPPEATGAETVAGVDQAFEGEDDGTVVSAAVAMEDGDVVETATARRETEVSYIPGLLGFREGGAAVESVSGLDVDTVLVDGSGRIHPRQAGLATHIGVALGVPTVGVAKSLLCGTPRADVSDLDEGERVAIVADDGIDAPDDTVVGYAYQSRQYSEATSASVNPLYVSPGHRVSAETAVDVVAEACDGYKLPEPVRRADALADEAKD